MKSCFVIMAIGDQTHNGMSISASDLKKKYDDLIKEAILTARPNVEVSRADEIALPGTITTDIITRIMHSDYVVADITYPNPNVYYELGLRHASRIGTLIIKERRVNVPFDVSHLRHIEYEDTSTGLKSLSANLKVYFDAFDSMPDRPDNQFQELAKLINFQFPNYSKSKEDPELDVMLQLMDSPEMIEIISQQMAGKPIDETQFLQAILKNPDISKPLVKALHGKGQISFSPPQNKSRKRRR